VTNPEEPTVESRRKAMFTSIASGLTEGFPVRTSGFRRGEIIDMLFAVPRRGSMLYRLTSLANGDRVFMVSLETTPELALKNYKRYCASANPKEAEK